MPEAALARSEPAEAGSATRPGRPDTTLRAVPEPAPVGPRLEVPGYDLTAALRLERELGLSHVLAQVLVRRGISDPVAARAFLDPQEVHDAAEFAGIDRAVALIEEHVERGSR